MTLRKRVRIMRKTTECGVENRLPSSWLSVLLVAVAGFVCVIVAPIVHADDGTALNLQQVEALTQQAEEALRNRDVAGAMAIYAPTYTHKHLDGTILTRSQVAQEMKRLLAQYTIKTNTPNFRWSRDGAMAPNTLKLVRYASMYATMVDSSDKMGMKGKLHTVVLSQTTHDYWSKQGGKWLMYRTADQTTPLMLVDGKPYPPVQKKHGIANLQYSTPVK
jgi:hypothetical protein